MSTLGPEPTQTQAVSNYIQALSELKEEIACAIRAISADRVAELRTSVGRQHAQSLALRLAAEAVQNLSKSNPDIVSEQAAALAQARQDLLQTTRAYEKLVERGRRSTSLLAALCSSHTGQYSSGSQTPRGRLQLSCEA